MMLCIGTTGSSEVPCDSSEAPLPKKRRRQDVHMSSRELLARAQVGRSPLHCCCRCDWLTTLQLQE